MSKLKEIEQEISGIKSKNTENVWLYSDLTRTLASEIEMKASKSRLGELETKRRFILDRRESWLPKTIWSAVVPIIVSIVTNIVFKNI